MDEEDEDGQMDCKRAKHPINEINYILHFGIMNIFIFNMTYNLTLKERGKTGKIWKSWKNLKKFV